MTLASFIDRNIQKYWYLEPPVYVVILQIQKGSIKLYGPVLFIPPARSTIYGTNSVHFLGSLVWNGLTNLVKSSRSIFEFKNVIKKLGNIDCACVICRR